MITINTSLTDYAPSLSMSYFRKSTNHPLLNFRLGTTTSVALRPPARRRMSSISQSPSPTLRKRVVKPNLLRVVLSSQHSSHPSQHSSHHSRMLSTNADQFSINVDHNINMQGLVHSFKDPAPRRGGPEPADGATMNEDEQETAAHYEPGQSSHQPPLSLEPPVPMMEQLLMNQQRMMQNLDTMMQGQQDLTQRVDNLSSRFDQWTMHYLPPPF